MDMVHKILKIIRLLFLIDKRPILLCLLCMIFENAERVLRILLPAFVLQWLVELAGDAIWAKTLMVIVCITVFGLGSRIGRGFLTPYSFRCSNLVQTKLREKLMKLSLEHSESKELFDRYELVDSTFYKFMDIDYILIYDFFGGIISFIVMSLILCKVNLIVYVTVLFFSVLLYCIEKKESVRLHEYENEKKTLYSKRKIYLDMIYETEKIKEMKLFRVGEMISDEYKEVTEGLVHKDIDKEIYSYKVRVKREVIALFQMIAIYLNAVREFCIGRVGTGTFYVVLSAATEIANSVTNIVNSINGMHNVTLYYNDFEQYMKEQESMYENEENAMHIDKIEQIEFRNVSFRYKGMEQYSLVNVSCVLKQGEKIALLGENGAGKTTFVKLLLRLYDPTEGEIFVNGRDVKSYAYDEYLNAISVVFQDTELMAYTILENIILDAERQNDKLDEVCRISGISKRLNSLKNGINTIVSTDLSEEGINFSGGECKKIAIARALYKGTQTLILDEPTSDMDVFAERELFENIQEVYKDSLIIYITHRISNVAFCNRIMLFQNARLVATGSHKKMMKESKEYKDMFEKQASYYN